MQFWPAGGCPAEKMPKSELATPGGGREKVIASQLTSRAYVLYGYAHLDLSALYTAILMYPPHETGFAL